LNKLIGKVVVNIGKFAILFALIFIFTGGELHIDLDSSTEGESQIFYPSRDGTLSEKRSSTKLNIQRGTSQQLVFKIPINTGWIRWDPIDGPGKFNINALHVNVWFFDIVIPNSYIIANNEIINISPTLNYVSIITAENAKDPSVKIKLPNRKILVIQLLSALILAAGIVIIIFFAQLKKRQIEEYFTIVLKLVSKEIDSLKKLPLLIIIACLFWILSLVTYSISIDDEFAAIRKGYTIWLEQGRWSVYLLTKYILPQPVIPFLPHFIFCISLSSSYLIILRAHLIKLDWKSVLLFPVFMAFPIWYYISEFYANLLAASLGITLCSIALLVFRSCLHQLDRQNLKAKVFIQLSVFQVVLLTIAIGAYQSYLFAFLSMGFGLILIRYVQNAHINLPILSQQVMYLILILLISLGLYKITLYLFQVGLGVHTTYVDGFIDTRLIIDRPWSVIESTVREAMKIYAGSSDIYGVSIGASGLLMLLGVISFYNSVRGWKRQAVVLILIVGCISVPFVLNLLAGGATKMPYRSLVAIPYVIWLFAAATIYINRNLVIKFVACILTVISAFQLINAHSTYSAVSQLTLEHDKLLAAEIYQKIILKLPSDKHLSSYAIDLYGAKFFKSVFPRIQTSTIGASFFDWDGGNPGRITHFMRLLGYDNVTVLSHEQRQDILSNYDEMSIWPSQQSIRIIGNVILVKMGETPGLAHRY
jgi:uncharacterized membrane protein